MGSDIRYHTVTLILVIIAVVVGVILGTSFNDPKKQAERDRKLREEFRRVDQRATENARLATASAQREREALEELVNTTRQLVPAAVRGRLAGKRIALLHTGGLSELPIRAAIETTLQQAGAEVASFTRLDPRLAEDATALTELAQRLQWNPDPGSGLDQFARAVAMVYANGDTGGLMKSLGEAKLAELASDYRRPVHAVVLIGGADETNSQLAVTVDRALIKALVSARLTVVGCETSEVPLSFVPEYTRQHISTVDNVESGTGQIALVWTLSGQRGHYGVKSGASGNLPPLYP